MNCTDCRDHIAAHTEHLLDPETEKDFERHLALCSECRDHVAFAARLHERLLARGGATANIAVAAPVMRRIHAEHTSRAPAVPATRLVRWWIGFGAAAAAAAAVVVGALLLAPHETRAQAVEVLNRGISATGQLARVHLVGRLRAPGAENFSVILAQADFLPIELWKELDGQKRWRIEKPGRIAWMDGQSTLLYVRPTGQALKYPMASSSAFDTDWLQHVANIEETLTNALKMAQLRGWKTDLSQTTDASGAVHKLVTIDVPASVPPGDYLANKSLYTAETRRLYQFSDQSGQLEALRIYMRSGDDYLLVFEVTRIDYNQPLADDLFAPALPAEVSVVEMPRPDAPRPAVDAKYTAMTAEQAARTFFEACARQDWNEVQVFFPVPLNDRRKAIFAPVAGVVAIGEAFTSAGSSATFVPYEITLNNGRTKKHNLALKKDPRTGRWFFDGGF